MPRPALADALADGNAEQLRSSNIRLLEQLQAAKRENAELERRLNAQPQVQVHARMKPEELDALYVEEQRQIEALTREVGQLRAQAAGGRAHRDASVAAAQDEVKRLTKQVEDLKETMRRQAQMAVAQLDQVRGAYAKELEERADECEAGRVQLSAMALELALSSAEKEKALRQLSDVERRAAEAEALMSGSAKDIARRATDAAAAANAAIAAATARAHAAEEQRDAAREEARRSEGAVEQIQIEISEARAMRDASFAALGEAQEHVKATEAKRQVLEAELRTTRLTVKRLEAAAAEVAQSHRVEIAGLSSLLDKMSAELAAALAAPPQVLVQPPAPPPEMISRAAVPPEGDGRSVFTDFVNLKRELQSLREENRSFVNLKRELQSLREENRSLRREAEARDGRAVGFDDGGGSGGGLGRGSALHSSASLGAAGAAAGAAGAGQPLMTKSTKQQHAKAPSHASSVLAAAPGTFGAAPRPPSGGTGLGASSQAPMYGSLALGRRAQQKEGHVGRRGTYDVDPRTGRLM